MILNFLDTFCKQYANIIIFGLNLFILVILSSLFIFVRDTRKRWNKLNDYLGDVTKTVNAVRYGNLTKKIEKLDIPDSENLTDSLNRMIETLHDREKMIDEFQKDLIKQNKILENTVNSLSDGLLIIDNDDHIFRANAVIAKWFDIDGKKLLGTSLRDYIKLASPKPLSSLQDDEICIISDKGSNFTASAVKLNLDDTRERFLIVIKNITPQKELETLKEDFVATLTHDLKVPIIAETNMIDLFLNEKFGTISEKQKLALKNMQVSNKELLDLVQIVLETYKIKDGNITLYKENLMLKGFINEIIEEMTPIAKKNNNTFNFKLERDIRVYADIFQLKRVVKNIIQNAISYGKAKSPIDITIGEIPKFVIIKIKDYGEGIAPKDLDRIFNRYYSAAKKFRKIGTGLGLYLALQIMKAHKGDITVESKEGEFTEFCIKIPVYEYERNLM